LSDFYTVIWFDYSLYRLKFCGLTFAVRIYLFGVCRTSFLYFSVMKSYFLHIYRFLFKSSPKKTLILDKSNDLRRL